MRPWAIIFLPAPGNQEGYDPAGSWHLRALAKLASYGTR
jgi:hypothetical protein